MKRYDSYKDSGVQWIGEIPEGWELKKLKYQVSCNDSVLPENTKEDSVINYVEIGDVNAVDGIANSTEYTFKEAPSRARRITIPGDVIVSTVRTYLKAIAPINTEGLTVSTGFVVLRPQTINPKFLAYSCLNEYFINEVISKSVGVSYPAINSSQIVDIKIVCPPYNIQQAIATYLDNKCAKIDKVIATQLKRIELLKELKQSVITHAVTRGINPDVKMKDSGVEWIGEVPEHWEVMPLKHCCKTNSGSTPKNIKGKENDDSTIKWIRTTDLDNAEVTDSSEYLTKEEYESASCPWLPVGTVLVAMYGGVGTIGKCGILGIEATINQALCSLEGKNQINSMYLFNCIRAMRSYWMIFAASSRKDPNISQEIIRNASIPLPSIEEQKGIVSHIERETKSLDRAIGKAQKQIDLLTELKQSVITEVVTGKRKVC